MKSRPQRNGGPFRRRGKEVRERLAAGILSVFFLPAFVACAIAIKIEGLLSRDAGGPIFFLEERISQGQLIRVIKFRTLTASALSKLTQGPTHIGILERQGEMTRVGRFLKQWYLDEMPQLINILKGDLLLIGTRPYPIEMYEEEMAKGITRKRDMPAGLTGPVQAHKGEDLDPIALDLEYWDALRTYGAIKLFLLDMKILGQWIRVQLRHKGL